MANCLALVDTQSPIACVHLRNISFLVHHSLHNINVVTSISTPMRRLPRIILTIDDR
jgi:hypothetical protein